MKTLIMLITLASTLFGTQFQINELEGSIKNKISLYSQSSFLKDNKLKDNKNIDNQRVEFRNYIDLEYNRFSVHSTIGTYTNRYHYHSTELENIWLEQDKSSVYVEKLYMQVELYSQIDTTFSFVYGIIPMGNSIFSQYANQDEIRGNAISAIIDLSTVGGFFILTSNCHSLKIGYGDWTGNNWYNDKKALELSSGNNGLYFIYDHTKGPHNIELNYVKSEAFYNHEHLADTDFYAIGYSYDDSFNSGLVYYGTFTYVQWKEYWSDILNGMPMTAQMPILIGQAMAPDQVAFTNTENNGYSYMLGVKWYTEIFLKEVNTGIEYRKNSKHFANASMGSMFLNNDSFWNHRDADIYTVYGSMKPSRDLTISVKYQHFNSKYSSKEGAITEVTTDPVNGFYKSEDHILVKLDYVF